MDYTEIERYIGETVSAARFCHCKATAALTSSLARRFPSYSIKTDDAYLVGLWHDVAREWDDDCLYDYCMAHHIAMELEERACPMLLHGAVAADLLKTQCADVPPAWVKAIRWHTIGSKEMGPLGAMLYIADYVEPYRTHIDNATKHKILGHASIEHMCLEIILLTEAYFARHNTCPLARSTEALKQFLQRGGTF